MAMSLSEAGSAAAVPADARRAAQHIIARAARFMGGSASGHRHDRKTFVYLSSGSAVKKSVVAGEAA
jgi:hypothetical protein